MKENGNSLLVEDKSFIDLLTEENLSKIDIDPRLIDCFKRVTDKLQTYFNANGYTSQRDYKKFFEEYLFKDMDSKLRIRVSDEPSKIGAAGFYIHNQGITEIHIDETYLNKEETLDQIFCHEFIHFLVMRELDVAEYPDPEIKNGGFINEALTEMLTQQIYPNSNSYQPQVNMLKFANLLTGNVNNYSLFLRGKVDCKGGASAWNNFYASANAYQLSCADKKFLMRDAINDPNYISAQRCIIQANISPHLISSFSDYRKWLSILQQRPVIDNDFIDKLFTGMDRSLVSNLGLRNENLKDIMYRQLSDYRQISSALSMYDDKDVYEFEIAGHKAAIDKDRTLYGMGSYSSSWNPNTGIWELNVGNETLKLDMNTIDFTKRKEELLKRQQTIQKYFLSNSKDDVKSVEQVAKKEGLVKLEKFTLPNVTGKKKSTVVYVATYNDRIEILNNSTQIGELENINSAQYIGLTSTDLKVGAIYSKPLDNIDKGIVFSKINQKSLHSRTISLLASRLTPTLNKDQITKLIEQYKQSDEYDAEDNLTAKELNEFAIRQYANIQYEKMSEEQKKALYDEIIKSNEQFVISMKDGKVDVSLLFGNKYVMAFKGQSELLVDTKGNGLYNEQFEVLSKTSAVKKISDSSVIQTNSEGNIIFKENKEDNEKMDEVKRENEQSADSELLNEYNKQLAELQTKYGTISKQMEDLMQQNVSNPTSNYQEKLNTLIQERDKISKEMEPVVKSQRNLQQAVDLKEEQEHKAVISQVERLLSTRIKATTDTGRFVKTDMGMFPQMDMKDSSMLIKEQGQIIQNLNDLYFNGEIDLKSKQKMVAEVSKEYQKMIKSAPKPSLDKTGDDNQREKEQEHKAVISQVEKLLSTRIKATTDTGRFVKTDMGMFPQMDIKDSAMLIKEQGQIIQNLNDLYFNGEIDLKSKQKMATEVSKEYQKMINSAPKPSLNKTVVDNSRENKPNEPKEQEYRHKYGYDMMSEDEKKIFEEILGQQRDNEQEKIEQEGTYKDKMFDMDELFREEQLREEINREQGEIHQNRRRHM